MTSNRSWLAAPFVVAVLIAACNNDNNNLTEGIVPPAPPVDLVYQLNAGEQIGAGDSIIEPGVLLSWLPPTPDSTIQAFVVYGSDSTDSNGFVQRAITTSITWHDAGTPDELQLQYMVESEDVNDDQSGPSNVVFISPGDTVQTPANLAGAPFDSAAELAWANNSVTGPNGDHFDYYRVYSESVSNNACVSSSTVLEGSTVSNAFVITGLANGVERCYFVTAVTKTGHESSFTAASLRGVYVTPESTDPPFSAARIPANATVVAHHPIALFRAHMKMRLANPR
jgi:hypothetical protein